MRTVRSYYRKELAPIIGACIVGIETAPVGEPHGRLKDGNHAPALVIELFNGQLLELVAWSDEEGNGPGALVMYPARNFKRKHKR